VCETLEEDLLRRDFTFNAMAVCPYTGEVVDYYDGRADLENKVVKFVGNPEHRIHEDYLRMLRAARFTCLIEGKLDAETFEAIKLNRHLIKKVSPERIRMELLKVMKYRKPSIYFNVLHDIGLLEIIMPEFEALYGHSGGEYHGETLDVHSKMTGDYLSPKDPLLRLVGYLHDIGKPLAYRLSYGADFVNHEKIGCDLVESILTKYKFSNAEVNRAKSLVLYHMRSVKDLKSKGYRRLVKKLADNNVNWKDWVKLKIADKKANLLTNDFGKENIKEICLNIFNAKHESKSGGFKVTDLAISGHHVMMILNILPGRKVGEVLTQLLEMVIENPELNNSGSLTEIMESGKCIKYNV
jgi:tRNA nucleotidyltransferase/poly(A) polymerase